MDSASSLIDGELLAFEELDGVPAGVAALDGRASHVDDLGQGLFHIIGEAQGGRRDGPLLARLDGGLHHVFHTAAFERGGLHDRAAQALREGVHVDLVAVFLHEVHHVEGHDRGDAQIDDLGGEVQVALEVRRVHQVDDRVGLAAHEVVAGDDLLGGVGRERVHAGQVGDDHLLIGAVAALLLLNGHAGPVSHILVRAGQIVEHGRLAAIGVAGKRNVDSHDQPFLLQKKPLFAGPFSRLPMRAAAKTEVR